MKENGAADEGAQSNLQCEEKIKNEK